jgi:hypothetical protein
MIVLRNLLLKSSRNCLPVISARKRFDIAVLLSVSAVVLTLRSVEVRDTPTQAHC